MKQVRSPRRGAATVEFAVLCPLLVFLFVVGVDFCRAFYHAQTVTNCARSGAIYGSSHPDKSKDTAGIEAAALADAKNLSPAPAISSSLAVDADGNKVVRVSASWTFNSVCGVPLLPASTNITRTVEMRIAAKDPKPS